jgi:CHASE1-domain containing sensor protein
VARQDGLAQFPLTERDHVGKLTRAGNRAEYFPVYFVEPYKGNEAAVGFDLDSSPPRRATLAAARDNGVATASGRVRLIQAPSGHYGILVMQPVYLRGRPSGSIAERQRNLRGFVLAVFNLDNLVQQSLNHLGLANIGIKIHDENGLPGEQLLFSSVPMSDEDGGAKEYGLRWVITPKFAGRDWRIAIAPLAVTNQTIIHGKRWSYCFLVQLCPACWVLSCCR